MVPGSMVRAQVTVRAHARRALGLSLLAIAGCAHPPPAAPVVRPGPRLLAPPPGDPGAFGHAYLDLIGVRLQGDWSAFLEDLRLRLPPSDPLNDASLVVQLDCTVAGDGAVRQLRVTSSGNAAFDRAAVEILRDAAPLAAPPLELVSDDGTLHLHWQFARDRRQAGIATARVERELWPVERAVPTLLAKGDLSEAARRLAVAAHDAPGGYVELADRVFTAALGEGLTASDVTVRRESSDAVRASGRALLGEPTRELARGAFDLEVRLHAIDALAADPDADAAHVLDELLARGPAQEPELTAAAARAIAAQGGVDRVAHAAIAWLTPSGGHAPDAARTSAALAALGEVAAPPAVPLVGRLLGAPDAITRAAACGALARSTSASAAWSSMLRGLGDHDATVRAACADAVGRAAARPGGVPPRVYARVAALLRDRDDRVRAAAAIAAPSLDGRRAAADLRALPAEKSAAVRIALAIGWGKVAGDTPPALISLSGDDDPAVRAAAVAALAARDDVTARALAARMAPDPDPRVRLAALAAIRDPDQIAGLLADDDPQVRSAALDRDAMLRGRIAVLSARATALAATAPASVDRVRIARSWILASKP